MNKICFRCKELKSLECFSKQPRNKDGFYSYCKSCRSILRKINNVKEKDAQYYQRNRELIITKNVEYTRQRLKIDVQYRLLRNLRRRISHLLSDGYKSAASQELIGCSMEHLKNHLESQFQSGMTWDNYGDWHVDHVKPCASFDLTDPTQQKACFHYSNLQPLWAKDNISKGKKW